MNRPRNLHSLVEAMRAIESLPYDKAQEALQAIAALCPAGTFASALEAADDRLTPTRRPPLLEQLQLAQPYAERLVYREGLLPEIATNNHDCIDGYLQIAG